MDWLASAEVSLDRVEVYRHAELQRYPGISELNYMNADPTADALKTAARFAELLGRLELRV